MLPAIGELESKINSAMERERAQQQKKVELLVEILLELQKKLVRSSPECDAVFSKLLAITGERGENLLSARGPAPGPGTPAGGA